MSDKVDPLHKRLLLAEKVLRRHGEHAVADHVLSWAREDEKFQRLMTNSLILSLLTAGAVAAIGAAIQYGHWWLAPAAIAFIGLFIALIWQAGTGRDAALNNADFTSAQAAACTCSSTHPSGSPAR